MTPAEPTCSSRLPVVPSLSGATLATFPATITDATDPPMRRCRHRVRMNEKGPSLGERMSSAQVVQPPVCQSLCQSFAGAIPTTGKTVRHRSGSWASLCPAQQEDFEIARHGPDSPAHPLKVAARVRIPLGLLQTPSSEPL